MCYFVFVSDPCFWSKINIINCCWSDRRHRRKQGITGQSDTSGNLKASDRVQDEVKERKMLSSGSRNTLEEQVWKFCLIFLLQKCGKFPSLL